MRQYCFTWQLPANGICRLSGPALLAAESSDQGEPLLRRIPMLDALAHQPQAIDWAIPGVYSVELKGTSCFSGQTGPCFQAIILDAVA
jgi:hypothetical protein